MGCLGLVIFVFFFWVRKKWVYGCLIGLCIDVIRFLGSKFIVFRVVESFRRGGDLLFILVLFIYI